MENLMNEQTDTFDCINRAKTNYTKTPKTKICQQYVQVRLDILNELWSKFNATHKEIVRGTSNRETLYFKDNLYEVVEELYVDYKTELTTVLDSFKRPVSFQNIGKDRSNIKLPEIVIPTFTGLYSEWTTFRELFVSLVHNNTQLENVQKLHYLKSYLSGEAEQLIRQVPISDSNYDRCWVLLDSRYNNRRFMCHALLRKLLNQKSINNESANMLKSLLDTTTDCLSGLTNIGVDVSSWDILIVHLLTLKLDLDSRKEWEIHFSNLNELDALPTLSQFTDFLTRRFRALEFLETKSTDQNKHTNVQDFSRPRSPRNFHIYQSLCEYCNEQHKIGHCKKFVKQDVNSRRKFIEQNSLCYNCFGHHAVRLCQSIMSCRVCRRKHHSMLHHEDNDGFVRSRNSICGNNVNKHGEVFVSTSREYDKNLDGQADNITALHICTAVERDDRIKVLRKQEADHKHQSKTLSHEEDECNRCFAQTVCRDSKGHYIVRHPFKKGFDNSKIIAEKRLEFLGEPRFKKKS